MERSKVPQNGLKMFQNCKNSIKWLLRDSKSPIKCTLKVNFTYGFLIYLHSLMQNLKPIFRLSPSTNFGLGSDWYSNTLFERERERCFNFIALVYHENDFRFGSNFTWCHTCVVGTYIYNLIKIGACKGWFWLLKPSLLLFWPVWGHFWVP